METALHELPTRHEVAAFLRVSDATVDRLVRSGELEAVKFGATVRLTRSGVEAFLAKNKSTEPAAPRTRKAGRTAK